MQWLPRRIATASLLGILVFANPATSGYQSSSRACFPFAYAQYGCAPTDAPALDFYFTLKRSECGKYAEPFIGISIWRNLPASAPYSMELGGGDGSARRCLRPGACEAATSGSLHLDTFIERKRASGEYELHFRDGSSEKAKFDATRCDLKFVCR